MQTIWYVTSKRSQSLGWESLFWKFEPVLLTKAFAKTAYSDEAFGSIVVQINIKIETYLKIS